MTEAAHDETTKGYAGLSAIIFNGTLTKSPGTSNTDGVIAISAEIMRQQGASVEIIRTIDQDDLATGIQPDMRGSGYDEDSWPQLYKKVLAADIVIIAGPIWLGDNSSQTKKLIERLYSVSAELNDKGQSIFYGKVGGCIITGNEDGMKHCSMNVLYSLQHVGFTIPPQADSGWLGEIGPGPSYLDKGSGGPENDFTNKNTTFMTWNLLHMAAILKQAGGIPRYGTDRNAWQKGERFDFKNPEYR